MASAQLTKLFGSGANLEQQTPQYDSYVFFGCAGAASNLDARLGSVYLIEAATYASLGTVRELNSEGSTEEVTLKNKWIVDVPDENEGPLEVIDFSLGIDSPANRILDATQLPRAHSFSTDKVVNVPVGRAPMSKPFPARVDTYLKEKWTYSQALAHVKGTSRSPLLVEMESYGIGVAAKTLGILHRTIVVRVVTDFLTDQSQENNDSRQIELLHAGTQSLELVISVIGTPLWARGPR